jgi:hypothetical protein
LEYNFRFQVMLVVWLYHPNINTTLNWTL